MSHSQVQFGATPKLHADRQALGANDWEAFYDSVVVKNRLHYTIQRVMKYRSLASDLYVLVLSARALTWKERLSQLLCSTPTGNPCATRIKAILFSCRSAVVLEDPRLNLQPAVCI